MGRQVVGKCCRRRIAATVELEYMVVIHRRLHQTGRRVEEPALFKLSRRCISLDNDEFVRADVDFDLDFFLAMASGAGIAEHSRISFSQRNGSSKGGLLEICENDE